MGATSTGSEEVKSEATAASGVKAEGATATKKPSLPTEKVSTLETPICHEHTTFYDKKPKDSKLGVLRTDEDAKMPGSEVISKEAEKVHVLQEPIGKTRTTFYDKKNKEQVLS